MRADELKKKPDPPTKEEPQPDPLTILMEFELNERNIVEQAARRETTIQEAPAIVTVITAKELKDRGYRTVSDVLRTIPGFEGDRWEFNGWFKANLTRGLPGTLLVLLDGVNIVDPTRNQIVLDRKLPLDNVKRIEITSGPGSVLWGSNALLGVVNIITHDAASKPGFEVRVGGGDGPGARGSARAHVSYGGSFLDDLIRLRLSTTLYTTDGPELTISQQTLYGPFPAPQADGQSLVIPTELVTEPFARDWFVNLNGKLGIGPVTLGFFTGFEVEHRELASSGAPLAKDFRTSPSFTNLGEGLVSAGSDSVHVAYVRYNDRFLGQKLGLNAQVQFVNWQVLEDPLGVFGASDILPLGTTTSLRSDAGTQRIGTNLDFDWQLPFGNHLLIGGEFFSDQGAETQLTSFHPFLGPESKQAECPSPFEWHPDRDPIRPCSVEQLALHGVTRHIGALYLSNEWKAHKRVAVNAGVRGQFSSTYAPAVLLSGGLVVGLTDRIFFKAAYTEGFRPPDFQSTATRGDIVSGVTFDANPELEVERSRAIEAEVNAVLLENIGVVRRWYVRADYAYTRMENVIAFPAGRYENTGIRDIHTVELLTKLVFKQGHELWMSYYFVDVIDSEVGRLRNIANHIFNAGGRATFFDQRLQFMAGLTVRGEMEDLNRSGLLPARPLFEVPGAAWVDPTGLEVTRIPAAALLRLGVEGRNLFGMWDIGAWVYNAFDVDASDPDFFFDDRIVARPQAKPGMSFFVETGVRW